MDRKINEMTHSVQQGCDQIFRSYYEDKFPVDGDYFTMNNGKTALIEYYLLKSVQTLQEAKSLSNEATLEVLQKMLQRLEAWDGVLLRSQEKLEKDQTEENWTKDELDPKTKNLIKEYEGGSGKKNDQLKTQIEKIYSDIRKSENIEFKDYQRYKEYGQAILTETADNAAKKEIAVCSLQFLGLVSGIAEPETLSAKYQFQQLLDQAVKKYTCAFFLDDPEVKKETLSFFLPGTGSEQTENEAKKIIDEWKEIGKRDNLAGEDLEKVKTCIAQQIALNEGIYTGYAQLYEKGMKFLQQTMGNTDKAVHTEATEYLEYFGQIMDYAKEGCPLAMNLETLVRQVDNVIKDSHSYLYTTVNNYINAQGFSAGQIDNNQKYDNLQGFTLHTGKVHKKYEQSVSLPFIAKKGDKDDISRSDNSTKNYRQLMFEHLLKKCSSAGNIEKAEKEINKQKIIKEHISMKSYFLQNKQKNLEKKYSLHHLRETLEAEIMQFKKNILKGIKVNTIKEHLDNLSQTNTDPTLQLSLGVLVNDLENTDNTYNDVKKCWKDFQSARKLVQRKRENGNSDEVYRKLWEELESPHKRLYQ